MPIYSAISKYSHTGGEPLTLPCLLTLPLHLKISFRGGLVMLLIWHSPCYIARPLLTKIFYTKIFGFISKSCDNYWIIYTDEDKDKLQLFFPNNIKINRRFYQAYQCDYPLQYTKDTAQ